MQNPGTPQIPTIKYGDILNRASYSTFWDLQRLLQSISDKDPELRTVALRKYVMATRKRFIQQLALTRWLSTANIIQFNTALDQFHLNMNELLNTIEMSTYEVYCLHSQLYSMRTLKYEAELACSILGSGSYPSLPTSVTRGGVRGFPKIIPTDELLDRLNLSIRSKIALRQPLPRQYSYLSFQLKEGRLIIHNHYYYELVVMLEDLSIDSCWKIVSFQMEQKSIQGKLLLKDHQLSNKSNNNTQTEKVIKEHHSTRKKHLENYLFQKLLKENNVKESLLLMISLCDRSSMNFRLREVYIHWLQFIRKSLLKSYVDVKLIEIVDEHRIQIFFWKSIASDNMNTLNPIFQVVIELYVSQVEDEEIKVNQRLPTIAADILIPSTSKTVKGLEKEIPLHDLIGSFTSPERLYLTFAAYFSEKKLGFLYHRILSSISSPSAQGTLLENVVVVLKQHHLVFYPRSAKISEEEEAKLYVTVRVDARRGRFIVEAVDFTRLLSSCRTNLIRFEDEINDLQNENWFLRYLYDEHIQRDNYEEHNKVEGNNGATELLSYSTSFSTLDMIIEGMETIIQCNRYPVFSSSSSSIEYAADDERTQLQALTNYTTNTLIVWKAKYWYTKNIYQQKYQIVMNEMNKLEGDIKKRVSSLSTSLPSATSQPPSSLPEPSTTVKKAPFRPPPSDDNILSKKKVPSKQLQAQVSSKKDELAKEMYALYLVTTLAPQSSVPVNPPIFESNSVNSSSQTYLPCSLNYDFYLCKTEASLPSASGKTSKMKMTLIDRRLHQIDKTLQSLDLNDPEALERIIVDYEASWILKKFKVDYLPLTISIRPELLLSSETLPTHLSHLQVKLNEKSQNYQCLNSNNELLSLYNFQDNSFLITFFLPRSYQQILGVKDFDDENPLQERLPFASIIIDVFQIVNPSKVKENIHVRLLINSLSLQMKSLEASNITQLTTSQSSDNGKDVNPVTVANYSHHWTMYCTLEEKIQIHILQFLELLLKKAPLKAEMEYSTLTCVEAIRAVILTLWMLLIYGQIEKEETYDMIQKYDVQYALRPLTVTISPQDLPVILFAVDRITVNGNGKGGKSVAAELHFFRYFSFSFYDHSVVFLDTNYNRTNTFPLKEITPDNIPNMINQLQ